MPITDHGQTVTVPVSDDVVWFILLGSLGAGLSFCCYIAGNRHTLATTASIVAMEEPVTATLFSLLVPGEALSTAQVAGMALILGAVTGLSILQSYPSYRDA